jgi:hypothetical protein
LKDEDLREAVIYPDSCYWRQHTFSSLLTGAHSTATSAVEGYER